MFALEQRLRDLYRATADRLFGDTQALSRTHAVAGALLTLIGTTGYYAAYAIVIFRAIRGEISVGDLAFLYGAFARSRAGLQSLSESITTMADRAVYLNDLFGFFTITPMLAAPVAPVPAPRPIRRGFEFRNVTFQYPGSTRAILRDLSLRIDAGEHVALIGESGAGKTTIVKLASTRCWGGDSPAGSIFRRGVAEDRAGACLHAGRADPDPRRAHRRD